MPQGGEGMYWILSALPLFVDCIEEIYAIFQKFHGMEYEYNHVYTILMFVCWLILLPIYLLCINYFYLSRKAITYVISITCMIGVIIIKIVIAMISHKIKWGTFLGDVPEGLYCLLIGIPSVIVIIGIAIYYFIKSR